MEDYRALTGDALAYRIAAELDKPSVYMGGPSAASKRKAKAIVALLPNYAGAVDVMVEARELIHRLCLERGSTEGCGLTFEKLNAAITAAGGRKPD